MERIIGDVDDVVEDFPGFFPFFFFDAFEEEAEEEEEGAFGEEEEEEEAAAGLPPGALGALRVGEAGESNGDSPTLEESRKQLRNLATAAAVES